MRLLGILVTTLAVAGCAHGTTPVGGVGNSTASDDWGPLAVVSPRGGSDDASLAGTISLTGNCLLLEDESGTEVTLVWPADRTHWDATSRTLKFRNDEGDTVTVGDGNAVALGGSGDEGTPTEWRARMDWVAQPDAECVRDQRWLVGALTSKG